MVNATDRMQLARKRNDGAATSGARGATGVLESDGLDWKPAAKARLQAVQRLRPAQ